MKRVFKIFIAIVIFFYLLYRLFFYVDIFTPCFITIAPSWFEFSNLSMKRALKVLKVASSDDYHKICQNIKRIDPNISCGGFGGGCFYTDNPETIDISTTNRSLAYTAAIIVHETCHAMQNNERRALNETECNEMMSKTLKNIIEY